MRTLIVIIIISTSSHALAHCCMHVQAQRAGRHGDTAQRFHVQSSLYSALQRSDVRDTCQPLPLTVQALSSCMWPAHQQPGTARLLQVPLQLGTSLQCQDRQLARVLDCKSLHCAVKARRHLPCPSGARHSQMHVPKQLQCRLRDALCNHPTQLHA